MLIRQADTSVLRRCDSIEPKAAYALELKAKNDAITPAEIAEAVGKETKTVKNFLQKQKRSK